MLVILSWLSLGVAGVAWEGWCRRAGSPWTSLGDLAARMWNHPLGRLALLTAWTFIGWHVFARYTVPA
jgi:hypothetical protein